MRESSRAIRVCSPGTPSAILFFGSIRLNFISAIPAGTPPTTPVFGVRRGLRGALWMLLALLLTTLPLRTQAEERFIILTSTTSTENSGLLAYLLPMFTRETGISVRVVAKGTGQAIRLAEAGDADVLLVHHRPSEDKFMAEGHGDERRDVMYNDFVMVGPKEDPARIRGSKTAAEALRRIAATQATFTSRADDSGTHKVELDLWKLAGVDPRPASGTWYKETGSGMGATLNTAAALNAYLLSDRGTWLSFKNPQSLEILVEGDPPLFNPYGMITVSPKRHPGVKSLEAHALMEWITSPKGQEAIGAFKVNGRQLFFPSYKKS